jgi:alkanesulfonate monooxygenase SsuD/methylene tetrahydromethanopterin reductase-like flavin-dependent oxidoreductase (luciferase family)
VDGLPGPTDAWTTLAGLAVETSRVRLGTLVSPVTFRQPGPLAITVATIDAMSGGRVDLGLGAGWFEAEHAAYGIPFPPVGERFDILGEQLAIITGMWGTPEGDLFTYDGAHYQVTSSPARPKPFRPGGPTIIVGGQGTRRTPELAARYAGEFNSFTSVDKAEVAFERVRAASERVGRAASGREPIRFSATGTIFCGRTDAEAAGRASRAGANVDRARSNGFYGTPEQIAERIRAYREIGASRLFLQLPDLQDVDHVDTIAQALPLIRR